MKQWALSLILLLAALASASASASAGNPQVEMKTSMGSIVIELYPEQSPITVRNFLRYADSGFYKDTLFHRVIDGFMIQGGGFRRGMQEKRTRAPIRNESANGLKNLSGTIAMARAAEPDSAAAQFFINLNDNDSLDYPGPDGSGYAVFGRVVSGLDVVQSIGKLATGERDIPVKPVIIESVKRLPETK